MTDEFRDWDAAYLIGALSPADRAAYEEHLAGCGRCRAAVAELAPAVGLLSRVPASIAVALAEMADEDAESPMPSTSPAPRGAREALIRRARSGDRRRLGIRVILAVAAAAVIAAAVAVPFSLSGGTPAVPPVASAPSVGPSLPPAAAMQRLTKAPLTASVRLVGVAWGTRIDLSCRYAPTYSDGGGHVYALAVVGADGSTTQLSTWRVLAGADAHLSAGTALDVASIRAVQIRDDSGAVLMTYSPG
jgi:anti-sigma factor RsiW